jgi:hypothetical protein
MLATAPELAIDKFVPAFNAKFWENGRSLPCCRRLLLGATACGSKQSKPES